MARRAGQVEDAVERAKAIALRLLGTRGRSRAEMLERLGKRGVSEAIAERVVADLERAGLMGDAALASEIAEAAERDRPAGRALVEAKLERAAVEASAREAAVERLPTDEVAKAVALLEAEVSRVPARLDAVTRWRRLLGLLRRRGFDEETAMEAARRVLGDPPGEGVDG